MVDRCGRRWVLAGGGIVTVLGNLMCALARSYTSFLVGRFVAGAGAAMVLTGGQIVVADISTPANRGRLMALYQGVFLFAVGAGPLPGGILADRFNLQAPFYANAIFAAVVALLAWWGIPETRDPGGVRAVSRISRPSPRAQLKVLTATPGFLLISIVSFVAFFVRTGGLFNVIPILAKDKLGLGPDTIGLGLGMISIVGLLLAYPSGELVDRFGRKAVIVPAALITGIACLVYAVAPGVAWFLVASAIWSTASGIGGAAPAAYAADTAPAGMTATALGTYRTISDFGYVVGPLTLGFVADVWAPDRALILCAVMLFISGLVFARFAPETLVKTPISSAAIAVPAGASGPGD